MTNVVNNNTQNISYLPSSLTTRSSTAAARVASQGGGSGGNGSQACAACKYQRRRCAPDCPLAPYFPAKRQKDFLNAHKLFGVSNILKVLKNISPFQKDNAMKALIFEANIRAGDPVGGCYRTILNLHRQINLCQAELQFVYREIFRVKAAAIQVQPNINTKACFLNEINNSILGFDFSPIPCLHEFDISTSIGEGSNSQIVEGERLEGFNNEKFEAKTVMSICNDKQSIVEHGYFKPYFGNFHDYKGKGIATELRNRPFDSSYIVIDSGITFGLKWLRCSISAATVIFEYLHLNFCSCSVRVSWGICPNGSSVLYSRGFVRLEYHWIFIIVSSESDDRLRGKMPPHRACRNNEQPQPVDPLSEHVSHAKFQEDFQALAQAVTANAQANT
ncbi:LOB domain-containing protein 22 [Capsicum chinense]|nr:LOB domain-containing protein 22 [Capsicum chinense]